MPAGADFQTSPHQSLGRTAGRAARGRCYGPRLFRRTRRLSRRTHDRPIQRVVTTAAIERGAHVLNLLTRRGDAVVAALAGGVDSDVAEHDRSPRDRAVTGTAVLIRLQVQRRFAERHHTVVTARAPCRDALMIESRRQPGDGGVAVLAGVVAGNVGRTFAGRQNAVMAARTIAGHAGVGDAVVGRAECDARLNQAGSTPAIPARGSRGRNCGGLSRQRRRGADHGADGAARRRLRRRDRLFRRGSRPAAWSSWSRRRISTSRGRGTDRRCRRYPRATKCAWTRTSSCR